MANRIELTEQEANSVAGGVFWYRTHANDDGSTYMTCEIDDVGTYYCTANAKREISLYIVNANGGVTVDDVIQYAVDNGLFWQ